MDYRHAILILIVNNFIVIYIVKQSHTKRVYGYTYCTYCITENRMGHKH